MYIACCRRPARQSALIVSCGELIIEGGHLGKLGDDLWPTLEQVGIAALDLGRWELAEVRDSVIDHQMHPTTIREGRFQPVKT